jgi:hypothetical protein
MWCFTFVFFFRWLAEFNIHKNHKTKLNDNKKRMLCEGSSLRIGMLSAPADLDYSLQLLKLTAMVSNEPYN